MGNASPAPAPSAQPVKPPTIVDYLSSSAQYSYFLRHLQRHELIPAINRLQNVTVFAPVNLAFVDSKLAAGDTPESLMRYFARKPLTVESLGASGQVVDSLYVVKHLHGHNITFPLKITSYEKSEVRVNDFASVVEADAYTKHQFSIIQTINRLIPVPETLCSILMDSTTNYVGDHSVSFVKHLAQLVFTDFRHSGFTLSCDQFLANVSTLLLPTDAWIDTSMLLLQKKYYTTLFRGMSHPHLVGTKDAVREIRADVLELLLSLLLPSRVDASDPASRNVTSLAGHVYGISLNSGSGRLILNKEIVSSENSTSIVKADGLIHVFVPDQKSQRDFFGSLGVVVADMIPRKALYSMHYSRFVRELKFRKLDYLIDGRTSNQTILLESADSDDVTENDLNSNDRDMHSVSFSGKEQLQYHFMEGAVDLFDKLTDDSPSYRHLLTSKLCLHKRINSCYKVKLSGKLDNKKVRVRFNDDVKIFNPPIHASGSNLLYVTDDEVLAPSSFKHAVAELISNDGVKGSDYNSVDKEACLIALRYFIKFGLLSLPNNNHGYTVLLPCGITLWDDENQHREEISGTWRNLGLVLKYLESNPKVLENVMKGLFIQDLIYSDFGLEDNVQLSLVAPNLLGDYVNISESYRGDESDHLIKINKTSFSIPLNSDILFNQGVIHITSKLLLPDSFHVLLIDLVKTTEHHLFPENSFMALLDLFPKVKDELNLDEIKEPSNYSLLIPSPDLLKDLNMTGGYDRLFELLQLHLIPNTEVDSLIQCLNNGEQMDGQSFASNFSIHTNSSRDSFNCAKNRATGESYIHIDPGDNLTKHNVRIISHGCTQFGSKNSSCVFLLERPLAPEWFDAPSNFLHLHVKWISVCIGIIMGVILFGCFTTAVVLCIGSGSSKKSNPPMFSNEPFSLPNEPRFMRVTSDEDFMDDCGYETDDDMLGTEREPILGKGKRKIENPYYSSLSAPIRGPNVASMKGPLPSKGPTAPRSITRNGLQRGMSRDHDFPVVNF